MHDEVKNDQLMVELQADIDEFRILLDNHATRPNVKKVLESWIQKCETEKKSMEALLETQFPKKIEKPEENKSEDPVDQALKIIDQMTYESLTRFGWD